MKIQKYNMHDQVLSFGQEIKTKDTKSVYYLVNFLSDFAVSMISATYVLFLLSQGLDLLQVNLVNLAFMLGNFFFEIPTGAYADFFGRRKSVILSLFFITMTFVTYFFSTSLWMFILAELLAALAFTFQSGALDAWLVDSLEKKGYIGKVDYIFSHASFLGQIASLLGGLVGAYIGAVSLRLPLGAAAVFSLAALFVAIFFMHEERLKRKKLSFINGFKSVSNVAKEGILYGVRHKVILWLTVASMVAMFAFMPLNMYWSPRMNQLAGNQVWLMGWVWAGISLSMMLGSLLIKQLLKKEKSYLWIQLATVLFLAVPIIFASMFEIFSVVLTGFLVYEVGRGMYKPIQKSYLNKHIQPEHRATVMSFDSMIGKLGAAGGLVILGWVGKNYSIQYAWLASGILLLLLIPIYLKVGQQEKSVNPLV